MSKRLFVAVNLDAQTKAEIGKLVDEIQEKMSPDVLRGMRFAPSDNWHLTLSFLGYQNDDVLPRIAEATQTAAANFRPQEIIFKETVYGPPGRGPRMIWLLTDKNTERGLSEIKTFLEDELEAVAVPFRRERRPFTGHLTLARFAAVKKENLPPVERDFKIVFAAASLDSMESKLKRGGAEYEILQEFPFGGNLA